MLEVKITSKFKKDYKLIKKRKKNLDLLKQIVFKLANQISLDEKYRDHELTGKYKGFRECPRCVALEKESSYQKIVRLFLEQTSYSLLHEFYF